LGINILKVYILVINGLCILGVLVGFYNFSIHFLDEVLFQNMTHINDFLFLGDAHVALGILFSCVVHKPPYLTWIIYIFVSFLFFWWVLIRKLCMYVETLWVQGRGNLFKAL
jgi:hypothetical protein